MRAGDLSPHGVPPDEALRLEGALRLARALLQQVAMSGTAANDVGWVAANIEVALRQEFALSGAALDAVMAALRTMLDEIAMLLPETRWEA
jgi:hypothetical protein